MTTREARADAPDSLQREAKAVLATYVARVARVALAVDATYLLFFWAVGSFWLSVVNVGSLLVYGLVLWLLGRRRLRWAVILVWSEVLLHVVFGTLALGWEAGFHYFVLPFLPLVAIVESRRRAVVLIVLVVAYLVGLDVAVSITGPLAPIGPAPMVVVKWFNIIGFVAVLAVLARHYRAQIAAARVRLDRMALTDALTRLPNRHHFEQVWLHEVARHRRTGSPACLVLLDLDHFKRINDQHGHAAGDNVLRARAVLLRSALRDVDTVARWGGEEFLILMPDTPLREGLQACERLRRAIEAQEVPVAGQNLQGTASFGLTLIEARDALPSAVSRADAALYRSKQGGRNRVSADGDGAPDLPPGPA